MNTLLQPDELLKLPHSPGVYKFYNKENKIIYVGKAKNLKKRVSSYFTKSHIIDRKTLRMVREVKGIEVTLVDSEFDALLLENNLIKEQQPKYNINLKDDKSFPFICITNERFPRIISTRRYKKINGEYFGPYTNVKAMKSVLDLIHKLYTIRTCKLNLSEENIDKKKFKVCLEYHIGNCLGPCENLQDHSSYLEEIEHSKEILKGNLGIVKSHFKSKMAQAADNLQFEMAQRYKLKFEKLEKFQARSVVVNQKLTDIDIFTIVSDEKLATINFMRIVNGAIKVTDTVQVKKKLDESNEEILQLIIENTRWKYGDLNNTILSNINCNLWEGMDVTIPIRGDKKKLVELSIKNALYYKKEQTTKKQPQTSENRVLQTLKNDLRLKTLPIHIECFDNSNIQGSNPVASMVCFKNAKPSKKDYRHFNIKSVSGPDDFKSMKEIVFRRYNRLIIEGSDLPQLVVIDGGKGQLNAAREALKELNIYGKIPIIGVAKKLEEIYFPEDLFPIHLSKKSESLKLIQRLRDEAHRFAITFHRTKRSNAAIHSALEEIDGIGKSTIEKLLSEFKSVKNISSLDLATLTNSIGKNRAQLVHKYFRNKKSTSS
ncbi:MAG: excinuclease ABC subunit UvrC [Cyclobacteriaceae bacterium]